MASLYDKTGDREMLFDNGVIQPMNLAIRGAWFAGGIEWNMPLFGHSLQTADPVYMAKVTCDDPTVRIYEFDRKLETFWQLDIALPEDSRVLWVTVTLRNPHPWDVPMYWWTNIAVPQAKGVRVMADVREAVSHSIDHRIRRTAFPDGQNRDLSYPQNYRASDSVFFLPHQSDQPWIACVDRHGDGLVQCSTEVLVGRKFWTYGSGAGGQRWMDLLSEPGRGDYIELQAGLAPTQTQTVTLPANHVLQWTEAYGPLQMDRPAAHAPSYRAAAEAVRKQLTHLVPAAQLAARHALGAARCENGIDHILSRGRSWGDLFCKRTGKTIKGLVFDAPDTSAEAPWRELLNVGCFSPDTLERVPESWNVSQGWREVLEQAHRTHGGNWLVNLHLAVAHMEEARFDEAKQHLRQSLDERPNAIAHRNLALIHQRNGVVDEARQEYESAWALGRDQWLALELATFYEQQGFDEQLLHVLDQLPPWQRAQERFDIVAARAALRRGDAEEALRLIDRDFATIAEGETTLSDLWFTAQALRREAVLERTLSTDEREALEHEFPLPPNLEYRMD